MVFTTGGALLCAWYCIGTVLMSLLQVTMLVNMHTLMCADVPSPTSYTMLHKDLIVTLVQYNILVVALCSCYMCIIGYVGYALLPVLHTASVLS